MKRVIIGYLFSAIVGSYISGLAIWLMVIMSLSAYDGSITDIFFWPLFGVTAFLYIAGVLFSLIILLLIGTPIMDYLLRRNLAGLGPATLCGAGAGALIAQIYPMFIAWLDKSFVGQYFLYALGFGCCAGALYAGLAWLIIRPKTVFLDANM